MRKIKALLTDPELPKWCLVLPAIGAMIPGPLDEVVIFPVVLGFLWLRKRHLIERHGLNPLHVLMLAAVPVALAIPAGMIGVYAWAHI